MNPNEPVKNPHRHWGEHLTFKIKSRNLLACVTYVVGNNLSNFEISNKENKLYYNISSVVYIMK